MKNAEYVDTAKTPIASQQSGLMQYEGNHYYSNTPFVASGDSNASGLSENPAIYGDKDSKPKRSKIEDVINTSDKNDDIDSIEDDNGSGEQKTITSGSSDLSPDIERKQIIADTLDDFGQAALASRAEKKDEIIRSLPKPEKEGKKGILARRTNKASDADIGNKRTLFDKMDGSADKEAQSASLKNLFSAISGSDSEPKQQTAKAIMPRSNLVSK